MDNYLKDGKVSSKRPEKEPSQSPNQMSSPRSGHISNFSQDMAELRRLAQEVASRPVPRSREVFERLSPIEEAPVEKVDVSRKEASINFLSKLSNFEEVPEDYSQHMALPNFDDDSVDVDPDMLSISMVHSERDNDEDEDSLSGYEDRSMSRRWQDNWLFNGRQVLPSHNKYGAKRSLDMTQPAFMMVPKTEDGTVPRVGNR